MSLLFNQFILERIYKQRDEAQQSYFSRVSVKQQAVSNPLIEIAEQVYAPSPLDFGEILSHNLDIEQRRTLETSQTGNTQQMGQSAISFRTKKQVFEWGNENFKFEKFKVDQTPISGKSGIQLALEEAEESLPSRGRDLDRFQKPAVTKIVVTVFLPHKEQPVRLEVTTDVTVAFVINQALNYREKDDINVDSLKVNPKAYMLKLAQEDGTIDEDMPALGLPRQIGGFFQMSSYFALVPDPRYKEVVEKPVPTSEIRLFKVHLHRNENNEGSGEQATLSVVYQPDLTLQQLLNIVFKNRFAVGKAEEYGFCLINDPNNTPITPLTQTIGELGVMSLKLIYNSDEASPSPAAFPRAPSLLNIFSDKSNSKEAAQVTTNFTLETAQKYAEYVAYQTAKFTSKTELFLGIDGNKIYTGKSKKGTRKPIANIKDIVKVTLTKKKHFHIDVKPDSSQHKVLKFESSYAQEIVAKLNCLIANKPK